MADIIFHLSQHRKPSPYILNLTEGRYFYDDEPLFIHCYGWFHCAENKQLVIDLYANEYKLVHLH